MGELRRIALLPQDDVPARHSRVPCPGGESELLAAVASCMARLVEGSNRVPIVLPWWSRPRSVPQPERGLGYHRQRKTHSVGDFLTPETALEQATDLLISFRKPPRHRTDVRMRFGRNPARSRRRDDPPFYCGPGIRTPTTSSRARRAAVTPARTTITTVWEFENPAKNIAEPRSRRGRYAPTESSSESTSASSPFAPETSAPLSINRRA